MKTRYLGLCCAALSLSALTISSALISTQKTKFKQGYVIEEDQSTFLSLFHPLASVRSSLFKPIEYISELTPEDWMGLVKLPNDKQKSLTSDSQLKLITIGGGLTAGMRNGGLYRESQLTAYPNLVAHQLGIASFTTPAFGNDEANGTGFFLLINNGNQFPDFQKVANKVAYANNGLDEDPPIFQSYNSEIHNISAPGLSSESFGDSWAPSMRGLVVNQSTGKSWPSYMPFVWRFSPKASYENSNLYEYLQKKDNYNFFILEDIHERFLKILRNRDRIGLSDLIGDLKTGTESELKVIRLLTTGKKKGVVFTVPNFYDLALYNWYTPNFLKKNCSALQLAVKHLSSRVESININEPFWLLPTPIVDSLYRKLNTRLPLDIVLNDKDILTKEEIMEYNLAVKKYNEKVKKWALEFNLAVVDLEEIYHLIHSGEYVADDLIPINGSPRGNFFSSDGIYPTALGQAVIANEVLKSINQKYEINVQLIDISVYAKSINIKY